MKTDKTKPAQSTIKQLREIREKISVDIQDMSFEEIKKYAEKNLTLHPASIWPK